MATRYIYLDHELNEKLKKEDNASELIRRLLQQYYYEQMPVEPEKKQVDVFEAMEKNALIENNNKATQSLRDAILSEISQEEINKAFEKDDNLS